MGFVSAATCRRFQEARHVAPARMRTSPQAPKKRRPAGALQKMKLGSLTALFLIVSASIFNFVLINKPK
jgi:hypothetical protein